MNLMSTNRDEGNSWTTPIPPDMMKHLQKEIEKSKRFWVTKSHNGVYEVRDKFAYEVNLNTKECSCVNWQINSFPCPHAIAAIQDSNLDIYKYIHPIYLIETFRKSYNNPINPVSNVDEFYFNANGVKILPPLVKSPPGRRKKKRYMSTIEKMSKKTRVCGRCKKKTNHNKSTCVEPI